VSNAAEPELRLGTRGSALARAQAQGVADAIGQAAELVIVRTTGDGEGAVAADKRRWVDRIEDALLAGTIDLAVHSAKDVPGELAPGLELFGSPARADPRDALVGAASLAELPAGARVGTSSVRRRSQLLALRADIEVVALHGNVDTRLRRLGEGELDAIVLARAGLERLGRGRGAVLEELVPAIGQGALVIEARAGDERVARAIAALRDSRTERELAAERELARRLHATCETPIGAHARTLPGGLLELRAYLGRPDGSEWATDRLEGRDPRELASELAARLRSVGAMELAA
jgi:hydroxymethylbilane synthase